MHSIQRKYRTGVALTVEDVRRDFIHQHGAYPADEMLEIFNIGFVCNRSHIFLKPNKDYIRAEIAWYENKSKCIWAFKYRPIPKIWVDIADPDGIVNSNYGNLVARYDQLGGCINQLVESRNTRRAVMVYMPQEIQDTYNYKGRNDFVCTWGTSLQIVEDELYYTILQRSCDAIYGYRNDLPWHRYMQNKVVKRYNRVTAGKEKPISRGPVIMFANNLHIYPRHRKHVK